MSKESALEIKDVEEFEICVCFHKNIFQSLDFTTLYLDNYLPNCRRAHCTQPVKLNLNEKLDSKQKTIQIFNIDAQGFRKTRNENPPTQEIGIAS